MKPDDSPELAAFEAQLRGLAPAPVPPALERSTAEALRLPRAIPFYRRPETAVAGLLAAAAAVALFLSVAPPPLPPAAPAQPRWTRAATETREIGQTDDGFIALADGGWMRRVRTDYIDTIRWADPATGAQMVVTTPRQEIFVEPVRAF